MNNNLKKTMKVLGTVAVAAGILVCGVEYSAQIRGFVSTVMSKIKIKES